MTTILTFRHLMEEHRIAEQILEVDHQQQISLHPSGVSTLINLLSGYQ
jgi:hypothetical protein